MTYLGGVLDLTAVAWLGFTLACASVSVLAYPSMRPRLVELRPQQRAIAIAVWAALPPAGGLLLTAVCFLPSILSLAGVTADHCLDHDDGHPHMCLIHPPETSGLTFAGIVAATLVFALAQLHREVREHGRLRRVLRTLDRASETDDAHNVRIFDSPIPLAFAAFLLRPRVFISSRLALSLPRQLLDVVIEHERAHVRRRDRLICAAVSVLSRLHVPWIRARLLQDLSLACEQACDEEAAVRVGDRLRVASAILAVERMCSGLPALPHQAVSSFGGTNIVPRILSLLHDAAGSGSSGRRWTWVGMIMVALTILASDSIHHLTETILTPFTR
ncbi:MAG: M56 family metallopeptidase [Acidobacteriota bacterium]